MRATVRLDPSVTLEIGNDMMLGDANKCQAFQPGCVGLRLVVRGTHGPGEPEPPEAELYGCYLKPSEARAVASMILSAATEARA